MSDKSNITLAILDDQECNNKLLHLNNSKELSVLSEIEWPSFCSSCKQDLKSLNSLEIPRSIEEKMHCHSLYVDQVLENSVECSLEVRSENIELDDTFMRVKRCRKLSNDESESKDFLSKRMKIDLNATGDLIVRSLENEKQKTVISNNIENLQGINQPCESGSLPICTKSQYFNETDNRYIVEESHSTFATNFMVGKNNESIVETNAVIETNDPIDLNTVTSKDVEMMEIMEFQDEYDSFPSGSELERIEREAQKINSAISLENIKQCVTVLPDNSVSMLPNIFYRNDRNNRSFNARKTNSVPDWMMKPLIVPEYNKLEASLIRRRKCVLEVAHQLAKLSTYIENIRKTLLRKDSKNLSLKPPVRNDHLGKSGMC